MADERTGGGGGTHLDEAEQGRGGAGHCRVVSQGAGHGLRQHHAGSGHKHGLGQDDCPGAVYLLVSQQGHGGAGGDGDDQAVEQDLVRLETAGQADGGHVTEHVTAGGEGGVQAEVFRGHAKYVDQHEGGAGQEGEQAAIDSGTGEGIADKGHVGADAAVVTQQAAQPERLAVFGAQGFRDAKGNDGNHNQGVGGHDYENPVPVHKGNDKAPERRGHCGRQGHHAGEDGKDFGGFSRCVDVPHNGTAQYRAGGAAEGLEETEQLQGFDVAGQGAADTGEGEQQHAADHHRLAAKAVGQWAADELGNGKANQVNAQGKLDLIGANAEIGSDLGQCRQIHINRHGRESHGSRQQNGCPDTC